MFIVDSDGDYKSFKGDNPVFHRQLPAGIYSVIVSPGGVFFRSIPVQNDTFVKLDAPAARMIAREVESFFDPVITARLRDAGLKNRRGVILYGSHGTGKTSLIRALLPGITAAGAVVLSDTNADHLENIIIPAVRESDPDRPIVLIWDEFEVNAQYSQKELLRLLDGVSSPDRLLVLATTNYLDKVPKQLCDRPSRFSLVLEMPPMNSAARMAYAQRKYSMLDSYQQFAVVELTLNRSLDYLEEALKLLLMGYDFDEIQDRMCNDISVKSASVDADEENEE